MAKTKDIKIKEKTEKNEKTDKTQREEQKKKQKTKEEKTEKVIRKESVQSQSENAIDEISMHEENEETIKEKFQTQLKIVKEKLKIDDKLISQATKCLKQLLNQKSEAENNILFRKDEESLQINFTFGHLPESYSLRPVIIPVPVDSKARRRVCLIIRDPAEDWLNLDINFDNESDIEVNVITYASLKQEYFQYEQRRNLLKQFDVFLCDNHIYMMLKKILGKAFYDAKKYPFGITIDKKKENSNATKELILNAARNTMFYMSNGPNYTIKAGYVEEEESKLLPKIKTTMTHTLANILKWGVDFSQLKGISLKFTNSIELPIFNQLSAEEIKAGKELLKEKNTPAVVKDAKIATGKKETKDKKDKKK